MGVNFYSYFGPVLELSDKKIEVEYKETVCPNGHKVNNHDNFCKQCGSKTEQVIKTKTKYINIRDEDEEGVLDCLTCIDDNNKQYIFDDIGITLSDWDDSSYEGFEINEETLSDMKEKFNSDENAIEVINLLTNLYGSSNFTIKFKMIMYAS